MTCNADDPSPNIASVMPLLTFPGTGIYEYAKNQGYFIDDDDYWEKYGENFRIQYTEYSYSVIQQIIDIANSIYRWNYYQHMADIQLFNFPKKKKIHIRFWHFIKRLLKMFPKLIELFGPILGDKQIESIKLITSINDQRIVSEFEERCFVDIIRRKK